MEIKRKRSKWNRPMRHEYACDARPPVATNERGNVRFFFSFLLFPSFKFMRWLNELHSASLWKQNKCPNKTLAIYKFWNDRALAAAAFDGILDQFTRYFLFLCIIRLVWPHGTVYEYILRFVRLCFNHLSSKCSTMSLISQAANHRGGEHQAPFFLPNRTYVIRRWSTFRPFRLIWSAFP